METPTPPAPSPPDAPPTGPPQPPAPTPPASGLPRGYRMALATELELLRQVAGAYRRAAIRGLFRAGVLVPLAGGEDPPPDDPPKDDPPKDDPPVDDPPKDEWTPPTKEEWERAQEAAAEANKRARKLERQAKDSRNKDNKDQGRFEELYTDATKELDTLKSKLTTATIKSAVGDAARRLNLTNPDLAFRLIDTDGINVDLDVDELDGAVDQAGKTLIEKRLQTLIEKEPYLVGRGRSGQLPGAGGGGGSASSGNEAMNQMLRRAAGRA